MKIASIVNWQESKKQITKKLQRHPSGLEFANYIEEEMIRNLEFQIKCIRDKKYRLLDNGLIAIEI